MLHDRPAAVKPHAALKVKWMAVGTGGDFESCYCLVSHMGITSSTIWESSYLTAGVSPHAPVGIGYTRSSKELAGIVASDELISTENLPHQASHCFN